MDTVSTVMQQNSRDADSVEENSAYSANDEDYNDGNKKVFGGIGGEGPNNTYFLKYKNKQHSKNTRSKRKYYIEALKEEICTFSDIYNTREHDRREALNDLVIQTTLRKQALSIFFHFRTSAETNPGQWTTILEDNFICVMPVPPYLSFPPQQYGLDCRRHMAGITAMINDAQSLQVMFQTLSVPQSTETKVELLYEVDIDHTIMSNDTYMCKWKMRTSNLVACGGAFEVTKHGMLFATFSAENKLQQLEITFDVMSFMQQLRRVSDRQVSTSSEVTDGTIDQAKNV